MKYPLIIGVAGGSASGKSTFAQLLANAIHEKGISVKNVSMDSYFLPDEKLPVSKSPVNSSKEYRDYNHPDSFDLQLLNKDIDAFAKNGEYSVIIIEGLLTLWETELRNKLSLKLFIDCPSDIRIVRRLKRNMQYGLSFDEIADVYVNLVRYRHEEFVEPTKNQADLIIDGSSDFKEVCNNLLKNFILKG